jgi:VWFA-related protein
MLCCVPLWSQATAPAEVPTPAAQVTAPAAEVTAPAAEVTTKEAPVTFQSGVNLVMVPVVVRDSAGRAVGTLGRDDFQIFDNGKPELISKFTLEKIEKDSSATKNPPHALLAANGETPAAADPDGIPDHFIAYLFDDLHMTQADLVYTRDAARRQIDAGPHTLDRAAIYTTSGRQMLEFTGDRDKLHATLAAIATGHADSERTMQQNGCPQVSYFMADRLYNRSDQAAWVIAMQDVISCANLAAPQYPSCIQPKPASGGAVVCLSVDLTNQDSAQGMVITAARAVLLTGDRDTAQSLDTLRNVVTRMASMPGQRSIVLVSPGFLVLEDRHDEEMALVERAIKASVVIGALDSRGLYTQIPGGDASTRVASTTSIPQKIGFQALETVAQSDIMASLAMGTGGAYYQGTNDYDEGFARTAAPPEYLYVLGFSPSSMKLDGRYHPLKIVLSNFKGLTVQARKGYYAPQHSTNPADQAKQQIEEVFFSREQIHDLPAVLQTQYFKSDDGGVRLSATAEIDVKKLAFHKEGDRNRDDVTVVTGLFDNDGNYVTGSQKIVEMRLRDETLQKRVDSGIGVRSSFAVHPGRYMIRMVVRDSEGQAMAAQSSLVEIP